MALRYNAPVADHILLSLDLGKWKVGIAAFAVTSEAPTGTLLGAETVSVPRRAVHRPVTVAEAVHDALPALAWRGPMPLVLVAEWPQKYPTCRAAHRDLEALYAVGREITKTFDEPLTAKWPPAEWKGNVPKPAHRRRIAAALTDAEHAAWVSHLAERDGDFLRARAWLAGEDSHDAWDAVGIGLYALGRVQRGGVK
jgi:hypothetical protein